jgi:hypothetical protein
MGMTFRQTLLAGAAALALGVQAASPALAEEPGATAPRAMTSCFDLGWAIAEGFNAPRDCDGAWNYAILVGAVRICELEGNLAFADLIRGVKRQCDLYYASKPSTITDNQDFYKE